MALALRFRTGEEFHVGLSDGLVDVLVQEIIGPQEFVLRVEGRDYKITDEMATEVLPDVRVSAGFGTDVLAQVVIDAPKSVTIDRLREIAVARYDRRRD